MKNWKYKLDDNISLAPSSWRVQAPLKPLMTPLHSQTKSNFLTNFKNAGNKLRLPHLNTLHHLGSEVWGEYFQISRRDLPISSANIRLAINDIRNLLYKLGNHSTFHIKCIKSKQGCLFRTAARI